MRERKTYLVSVGGFTIGLLSLLCLGLLFVRARERTGSMTFARTFPVLCGKADLAELVGARLTENLGGLI